MGRVLLALAWAEAIAGILWLAAAVRVRVDEEVRQITCARDGGG